MHNDIVIRGACARALTLHTIRSLDSAIFVSVNEFCLDSSGHTAKMQVGIFTRPLERTGSTLR